MKNQLLKNLHLYGKKFKKKFENILIFSQKWTNKKVVQN